jgi:hypothetical protein
MQTLTQPSIVVEERFAGLPNIGHGGYVAGVLASALETNSAAVQMRRPVPPGRDLVIDVADDRAELRNGEKLLAEAAPAELELDIPAPVTLADAVRASAHFPGHHHHMFPYCFACGPARHEGDGLRIFPGPVAGRELVAAPWLPPAEMADADGHVHSELVWAALDCPQLWALMTNVPPETPDRVVTAALETRIEQPVVATEPHIVTAWPIGRRGRTWQAGAAVFSAAGELRAVGRQTAAVVSGWGVPLGRDHWGASHDHDDNR